MNRLAKSCTKPATFACYLFLSVGLVALAGCATGGRVKKEPTANTQGVSAKPSPVAAGPSVVRFTQGREGFSITEASHLDAGSRADFDRAVALIKEADYQKGVELLEKVIAASPGLTAPHIDIAIAYHRLKKPELAEQHLKTALELVPGHPAASYEYGLQLRKAGRFAEARAIYEKSLALFPEYSPISRNLGILCDLYLKDPVGAREHYEVYSKSAPRDKQVKLWLADLEVRSGHVASR